jgi:hypothetical protein
VAWKVLDHYRYTVDRTSKGHFSMRETKVGMRQLLRSNDR